MADPPEDLGNVAESLEASLLEVTPWGEVVQVRFARETDGYEMSEAMKDYSSTHSPAATVVNLLDSSVVFGNEGGGLLLYAAHDARLQRFRPAAFVRPSANESIQGLYRALFSRVAPIEFFGDVPSALRYTLAGLDQTTNRLAADLRRLESDDARRPDVECMVWDVSWPGFLSRKRHERRKSVESFRNAVLGPLACRRGSRIRTSDPPTEYDVPGDWRQVAPSTWTGLHGFDFREPTTARWLGLGSWTMYNAPAPLEALPDLFAMEPAQLVGWMRENEVALLATSFADGAEWRVALNPTHNGCSEETMEKRR